MQKKVHGMYISIDTAKAAVETLLAEGFERHNITLLSNALVANDLMDATRCQVLSLQNEPKRGGLKNLFRRGNNANSDDPLQVYAEDLQNGKIVVLIPEKIKI